MRLVETFALSALYGQLEAQNSSDDRQASFKDTDLDTLITQEDLTYAEAFDVGGEIEAIKHEVKHAHLSDLKPPLVLTVEQKSEIMSGVKATQMADVSVGGTQTNFNGDVMSNLSGLTQYEMVFGSDDSTTGCGLVYDNRSARRRRKRRSPDEESDEESEERAMLDHMKVYNGKMPNNSDDMKNHGW